MAASISLRSYLHIQPGPASPEPSITLNFVDISLSHTWPVSSLPWTAFTEASTLLSSGNPPPIALDPALVSALSPHLAPISPNLDPRGRKIHAAAASTFLYLFLLLSGPHSQSLTFTLRSTIPIGAGLGSSASISVCLATALLHLSSTLSVPGSTPGPDVPAVLAHINALAFLGESLIHGTPSGVDNTVSTYGKAVVFARSTTPGKGPSIDTIRNFPELPLLVVDTKQAKSTEYEVAKVRELRDKHTAVVEPILEAIHQVTESARALIAGSEGQGSEEMVEKLGELVVLNHGLLFALGKSHPRLEELREVVVRSGAGWFKLTGAGGGGCGFVLLRGDEKVVKGEGKGKGEEAERLKGLEEELEKRGFEKYETILGGEGVGILTMDQGREITLEEFVRVEGTKGVEELCGGDAVGWRHWRLA
ncbi:Mevalonate kinase [Elsinoe australis]|uniref:Mevalonate kinase n=1 Tax=Elsinoe australis TaxID=40998 RepID=A0A2P8A440_9PEZI|nr:Mevalonate kinase [Elsinoe australis]